MKPINDLITKARSEIGSGEQTKKQESGDFINLMFHNLKLIFPAWQQNFKTAQSYRQTKELWLSTLIDEGITTQEEIQRALKCARNYDSAFFPSIGQFIKWTNKPAPALGEEAHKMYKPQLMPHTTEEYKEYGEVGLEKLKELRK